MSLKFLFSAAFFLAASPIAAQPPAAPAAPAAPQPTGPQAEIQRTAMAFGQCISAAIKTVPAAVTPEAGATSVLGGCATQRTALDQAVAAMIATLPEDQKAAAQTQYTTQMGEAQTQIAEGIRQMRAAPPTPAPATPAH